MRLLEGIPHPTWKTYENFMFLVFGFLFWKTLKIENIT